MLAPLQSLHDFKLPSSAVGGPIFLPISNILYLYMYILSVLFGT
jgi:hypothetical protein